MNSILHTARQRKVATIIVVGCFLALLSYGYKCIGQKVCGTPRIDQVVRGSSTAVMPNGDSVMLEIADTPESHELGLSGRTGMREGNGLLFVFDAPGKYAFWMKDMQFAIDMIWMDENGTVVNVENNVTPESYTENNPPKVFVNNPAALYVLELKAGDAARYGVYLGTKIKIDL